MDKTLLEVFAPTAGVDYSVPDTMKTLRHSSGMNNVRLHYGVVRKDWGYSTYGTNLPVLGTPCNMFVYKEYDGDLHPLLFTTSYIYEFLTTDQTWHVIGARNQVIEDCEDAWVSGAEGTASLEVTIIKRGSGSAKIVLAEGDGTGIAAYENFSALDLSADTYIHLWMRANAATLATDLSIRISEENNGAITGGAGVYEDIPMPALVADTWTEVEVAYADATTTRNATLSVSLIVNTDQGALIVYLDDIRSFVRNTGTQTDGWNACTHNGSCFATNFDDRITYKTDAGAFDNMAGAASYLAKDILSFKNHLVIFNNKESGNPTPHRVRWTISGALGYASSDWTGTGSGAADLLDTTGHIVKAMHLGDELAIYKEDGIYAMSWIGGESIYRFDLRISDIGLIGPLAVTAWRGRNFFLGTDYNIYEHLGDPNPVPMGSPVAPQIRASINPAVQHLCSVFMDEEYNDLIVGIPTGSNTQVDTIFRFNIDEKSWSKSSREYLCKMIHQEYSTKNYGTYGGTYGEATETYGQATSKTGAKTVVVVDSSGYTYRIDRSTTNLNGVLQNSYFDTIDLTFAGKQDKGDGQKDVVNYREKLKRILKTLVEAAGNSITISYSTDGGRTWASAPDTYTHTLESEYKVKKSDFDRTEERVRLRFSNSTLSSDMRFRYFALEYLTDAMKES